MSKFWLPLSAFLTVGSCFACRTGKISSAPQSIVTTPTPAPRDQMVPWMEIVLAALGPDGKHCFTSAVGSEVYSDETVPCPEKKEVDIVQREITHELGPLPRHAWEKSGIFFTKKIIDCANVKAMGCTWGEKENQISVISYYYPWRRAILRHELMHVVYIATDAPDEKHKCLDDPAACPKKVQSKGRIWRRR